MSDKNFMAYGDAETLFSEVGSELGKRILQMSTIPSASVDYLNMIIQYIGTTSETYTNGYFYKCIYDEDNSEYAWINIDVQDGGSGGYLGTGTLLASGWSSKQQTLTFAGYKASMNGVIGIPTDATAAQKAAYTDALVDVVSQSGNSFTFKVENVPEIDLPVVLYAGGGSGSGGGGEDVGLDVGSNGAIQSTYIDELEQEQTEDLFCNDTGDDIVTLLDSIADNVRLLNQPEVYAPIVYSTEEREIGVWTDGKPLYQRTWIENINAKSTAQLATNIENETTIGLAYYDGTNWIDPFYTDNAINIGGGFTQLTNNTLNLCNNMASNLTWRATVQYTKTTDVAGSGHYAALGVPAVHYSTTEQVIGTWIDGKSLYQITVETNLSNGLIYSVTNGKTVLIKEAYGVHTESSYKQYLNLNYFASNSDKCNVYTKGADVYTETVSGFYSYYSKILFTIRYTKTTD